MWSEVVSRRNRVALLLVFVVCLRLPATATAILANRTNTGRDGGPVLALAIDPRTSTTLYAGTAGGVFKTDDGGVNWRAVTTGLTNLIVRNLAIHPQIPATIYAGTSGGGVFQSLDGGTSWRAINTGLPKGDVGAVAINPQTPTTVYAGIFLGMSRGVFRSTDGGDNWRVLVSGSVTSLANGSQDPDIIYCAIWSAWINKDNDGGAELAQCEPGLNQQRCQHSCYRPPSSYDSLRGL